MAVVLLWLALSLSLFTLWTSPSIAEEQLRKKSRRTHASSKARHERDSFGWQESISRTRALSLSLNLQGQRTSKRLITAEPPTRKPQPMYSSKLSGQVPCRFRKAIVSSNEAPVLNWRGWFAFLSMILGVASTGFLIAGKVQSWNKTSETVPLLFDDDESDYSSGIAYSNSPSDIGYGTMINTPWSGDSFDKFDI